VRYLYLWCLHYLRFRFTTSSTVMWRPIDIPVVIGYNNVHMIVKLEDPCILFNRTVLPELQDEFYGQCREMYKLYFEDELLEFRPTRSFVDHKITKRFAVSLCVIIASVIVSAGIGAVTMGNSVTAMNGVHDLNTQLERANNRLDAAANNLNILNDKYAKLKETVYTVTERLYTLEKDHEKLKKSQMETIFATLYSTGRFLTVQQILKETQRHWNKREMHEPLLDYLNYTLPCGSSCPVSLGTPKGYTTSEDLPKIHLEFTVPVVNSSWQAVEADPFYIRQETNNTVCKLTYSGPKRMIIDKVTHCVHPVSNERNDLVLLPNSDCHHSKLTNVTLFTSTDCKAAKYDNVED